uniref:DUF5666 domain-containing protein n=1 Tax=mine drainage metagenome TaxID=410659 RepID=E6PRV5_9ZZZZ
MTKPKSFKAALGLGLAALLILLLASCGGGSTVASSGGGVGTGGTGMSFGTVTGFGSVVVDGTPYNSASPQYFAGNDQGEATLTAATAVQLGNQLRIQLDAQGTPSMVLIEPELMGAVANLSSTGFSVNGVPVQVNTNPASGPVTYYSGLTDYAGLSPGMQVEVHGAYGVNSNGQGYVQATLIEQLPATNPVTRITGVISHLQAASGTFQIGTTTVQIGAATSVVPSGLSLANGQLVNVWSNVPVTASGITAGVVRIRTLQGVSGPVQVGGLVSMLSGSRFQVSGVTIDASAPALASTVQGLTLGEYVVVLGQADASTGVVTASSIRAYATQPAQVELRGTITGYVSPSNFLVRGVLVDASAPGVSFNGGSAASLGNGVFVDILGHVGSGNGNVVTASSVTVLPQAPDGGTVDYQGTVSALNTANGTFTLTWQKEGTTSTSQVTLAPNVVFSNGAAAQLVNGANVEIEATNTSSGLTAYSVSFRGVGSGDGGSGGSSSTLETKGVIYNLTSTSFQVNALTIQINGVSPNSGTLANGVTVEVTFTPSGSQNLAKEISIDR